MGKTSEIRISNVNALLKHQHPPKDSCEASNEYVLNIAFFSFIIFCILETIFAIMANSQSMLADAAAMSIDALTYLFNLGAEWCKNQPLSEEMLKLSFEEQAYRVELRRQYLELIPPAISVIILIAITIVTTIQALDSLMGNINGTTEEQDVSVVIMFIFSAANLLLDIVNVTCFARANANYGMDVVQEETRRISQTIGHGYDLRAIMNTTSDQESSRLLDGGEHPKTRPSMRFSNYGALPTLNIEDDDDEEAAYINLNMCSAWTHVCADTMRSVAVLVASGVAVIFPGVNGDKMDASAAVVVSIIILFSLFPLIQGLILTAISIRDLKRSKPHHT